MTHNDYDREIALVVERGERKNVIHGVARLRSCAAPTRRPSYHADLGATRAGAGRELPTRSIQIGRDEKIKRIIALMSPENETMKNLCQSVGFSSFEIDTENGMLKAQIEL